MTQTPDWLSLHGKLAVITGAGSKNGIGYASALALCELGAEVVLTGLSSRVNSRADELVALGFRAHAVEADLTDAQGVEKLGAFVAEIGQCSILVNNAGMTSVAEPMETSGETGDILTTSLEGFEKAIARNLSSALMVSKHFTPALRKASGRIVNVSSVTGPVMAMLGEVSYAAAKAGLVGLTRAMAVDEAKYGVCVNAVAPGWIATESQTELEVAAGERVPIGRSATKDEVGRVIAFLCSPAASYLTGQLIVVDGGNSISEQR